MLLLHGVAIIFLLNQICLVSSADTNKKLLKKNVDTSYLMLSFDKYKGDSFDNANKGERAYAILNKRSDNYEEISIKNEGSFYSVNLEIGTPPQSVVVLVDTGSSDLWVTGSNNPYCRSQRTSKVTVPYQIDEDKGIPHDINDKRVIPHSVNGRRVIPHSINDRVIPHSIDEMIVHPRIDKRETPEDADIFSFFTVTTILTTLEPSTPDISTSIPSSLATVDCSQYGTFDVSASSSFTSNNTAFFIQYGDSSFAYGTWGQDDLHFQDIDVTGLSFAVANITNSSVGVLGIGLPGLETTYSGALASSLNRYQYLNFPMVLKTKGATKYNAYSLFLNHLDADSGSVLFGAVDHNKYEGQLYTIPLVNILSSSGFQKPVEFDVTLQGLGITNDKSNTTFTTTKIPALLDSGTTLVYMPAALTEMIAEFLGAKYSPEVGYYTMTCPSASQADSNLAYDFGGFLIYSPISNYILNTSSPLICVLGIVPQQESYAILGDTFLSSAYVVYDLEKLEISMAQANYENHDEDIEVITSGIPGAVKAPSYSNTWSTRETITSGGNIFTTPGSTPVSSNSNTNFASRSISTGSIVSTRSSVSTRSGSSSSMPSTTTKISECPSFSPSLYGLAIAFLLTIMSGFLL